MTEALQLWCSPLPLCARTFLCDPSQRSGSFTASVIVCVAPLGLRATAAKHLSLPASIQAEPICVSAPSEVGFHEM